MGRLRVSKSGEKGRKSPGPERPQREKVRGPLGQRRDRVLSMRVLFGSCLVLLAALASPSAAQDDRADSSLDPAPDGASSLQQPGPSPAGEPVPDLSTRPDPGDEGAAVPAAAQEPESGAGPLEGLTRGFLTVAGPTIPAAAFVTVGLLVGLGAGLGLGLRRRVGGPRTSLPPVAPRDPDLHQAAERLLENPLDATAHFRIGVETLPKGTPGAVEHLEYAFRLEPALILNLLSDPGLAPVREREDVRRLLARIHRERQRTWTGYA